VDCNETQVVEHTRVQSQARWIPAYNPDVSTKDSHGRTHRHRWKGLQASNSLNSKLRSNSNTSSINNINSKLRSNSSTSSINNINSP
jgi:hypothetical protein